MCLVVVRVPAPPTHTHIHTPDEEWGLTVFCFIKKGTEHELKFILILTNDLPGIATTSLMRVCVHCINHMWSVREQTRIYIYTQSNFFLRY